MCGHLLQGGKLLFYALGGSSAPEHAHKLMSSSLS